VSELQHPQARPFEQVAALYERTRPEYPAEAVEWLRSELDLRAGRTVLDLGAGTGKLTRALAGTGASVIAVEPGEAMLAELARAVPDVDARIGGAEAIPLEDGSVDAVTAGQSFHWFRHDEAVAEIHRVLRPGGRLALIWNRRDPDDALQQEISDAIAPLVPPDRPGATSWDVPLPDTPLFEPVAEATFDFSDDLDADRLVGRIGSISFVAASSAEARASLEERLRAMVAERGGRVDLRYVTSAYVSRAV
jgi:SAM-dependent methyltransferase